MSKILHFYTTFDCLIKCDNNESLIKKEKITTFSFEKELFAVSFFPLDSAESFDAVIDLKTPKVTSSNSSIKLVDFKDETYLIQITAPKDTSPKPYSLNYKKINFGESTHEIIYSTFDATLFCLKCASDRMVLTNEKIIGEPTFKTNQNHLLFFAPTKENKYIFGQIDFVNKKYEKVLFQEVDQIDINQNQITTLKHLIETGHHTIKKIYNLKNFSVKTQLASKSSPDAVTKNELIPYAFCDAIKVKNYDLARKYLSSNLNEKLDDLHLSAFFGEFEDIFQNLKKDATPNEVALFYGKGQIKEAKIFNYELENNKIVNIYEE